MEKLTLKYDGNHQVDATNLAVSILGFSKLLQKVSGQLLSENQKLKISVSAFEDGSLDAVTILEIWDNVKDIGMVIAPVIPQIVSTVADTIDIVKFLKGSPPKSVRSDEDGKLVIENIHNEVGTYTKRAFLNFGDTNIIYNINQYLEPTRNDISISEQSFSYNSQKKATVTKSEISYFDREENITEENVTIIGVIYDMNTETYNGKMTHSGSKISISFKKIYENQDYYNLIKSLKYKATIRITGVASVDVNTASYKNIDLTSAEIIQSTLFEEDS